MNQSNYLNPDFTSCWREVTVVPTLLPGVIHLWYIDVPKAIAVKQDLSSSYATKLAQDVALRDKHPRVLYTQVMRRRIIAGYLGIAPEELQFQLGGHGKPYLSWPLHHLQFSISHSGSLCLMAINWDQEVGLDLEQIWPRPKILAIAQRMFHPVISTQLRELPQDKQLPLFYYHWTCLEAKLKAKGDGLFSSNCVEFNTPQHVNFIPTTNFQACLASYYKLPTVEHWHFLRLLTSTTDPLQITSTAIQGKNSQ